MLALDKGNFHASRQESNSRPSGSVLGTSDKHVVFGGAWVQFSPGVRKCSLSRASMISPPSKLKVFTGSVSLKSIKIKIKLIYATSSSWEKNKMAGESSVIPTDFIFLIFIVWVFFFIYIIWVVIFFYDPNWSESNFILFLFFYSMRVDPTWTGSPSWSGPTFVPACLKVYLKDHVRMELKRQKAYLPLFSLPWCKLLFKHLPFAVVPSIAGDPRAYSAPPQKVECVWQLLADGYQTKHGHSLSSYKTLPW